MKQAIRNPIVRRMYEEPFKLYMMDEFMPISASTSGAPNTRSTTTAPSRRWEPHFMRQMGTLMVNHGIERQGHQCEDCHTPDGGLLDFEALGYPAERVHDLENLRN